MIVDEKEGRPPDLENIDLGFNAVIFEGNGV